MPRKSKSRRLTRSQLAQAASYVRYPPETYARGPVARIGPGNATFGADYKTATFQQRLERRLQGYTGQGAYMGGRGAYYGGRGGFFQDQLAKVKRVGARLGGMAVDRGLGMAESYASQFLGQGDYENNAIVDGGSSGSNFVRTIPSFSPNPDDLGGICISHKEYLTDIYGNSAADEFVNASWAINPGIEKTFPWLSQFAQNFEEYTMHQLIFTYRGTISNDLSTSNGQVGTIIMVVDYNPDNTPFIDKGTMMQYAGAVSSKVTNSVMCGVECDPKQNSGVVGQYVRYMPVLTGQDLKMYDRGTFQLALSGTPDAFANQPIGELWVSYTVALRKPRLTTGLGLAISTDQFAWKAPGLESLQLIDIDTMQFEAGLQNNIGCDLVYSQLFTNAEGYQVQGIGVRFPAYAASYYEIDLITGNTNGANWTYGLEISPVVIPWADVITTATTDTVNSNGFVSKQGNIMFLHDFPGSAVGAGNTLVNGYGTTKAKGNWTFKTHVKPGQALGADDNIVWFFIRNVINNAQEPTIGWDDLTFLIITVKEYSIMGNLDKPPTVSSTLLIPEEITIV